MTIRTLPLALACLTLAACHHDPKKGTGTRSPASCEAGSPRSTPTIVVDGLVSPFGIAVDETSVYWTEAESPGVIGAIDKSGANRRVLAMEGLNSPQEITLDSTHVYYQTSKRVMRAPKDGSGAPQTLAAGYDSLHSRGVRVDDGWVYFAGRADSDGVDVIARVRSDGTELARVVTSATTIRAFSLDADHLYVASGSLTMPTVERMAKDGTNVEALVGRYCPTLTGAAPQLFCAVDIEGPYRINTLSRLAVDLCPEWDPLLVVVDSVVRDSYLYLLVDTSRDTDEILRISTAGTGTLFATGLVHPLRLATDGEALYFTEKDDKRIRRIALE